MRICRGCHILAEARTVIHAHTCYASYKNSKIHWNVRRGARGCNTSCSQGYSFLLGMCLGAMRTGSSHIPAAVIKNHTYSAYFLCFAKSGSHTVLKTRNRQVDWDILNIFSSPAKSETSHALRKHHPHTMSPGLPCIFFDVTRS